MAQQDDTTKETASPSSAQGHALSTNPVAGLIKVSAWLAENVDSHDIVDHAEAAKDFTARTGLEACWPMHSRQSALNAIARRGVGGSLSGGLGANAWGYEMAVALATKYAPGYRQTKLGRGYIYREALDALRAAGA